MRLVSDREGNVSFGGEMLRRADGTPCLCERCGKPLGPVEAKMRSKLCATCVEAAPEKWETQR